MQALELLSGFATQPNTGLGITVSNGTLTVRAFNAGSAYLLNIWKNGQNVPGFARFRSPNLHDVAQAMRFQCLGGQTQILHDTGFPQPLRSQDVLTVDVAGSNVAGDIENLCAHIYWTNLEGIQARFLSLEALEARIESYLVTSHALVGAVTGAWGANQAINAGLTGDLFKADRDYALLGGTFSETAANNGAAVSCIGPDTGNFMVGIPVVSGRPELTQDWFVQMTKRYKVPLIPVINAANKGGTFLQVLNNENANTVTASLVWALLK